MTECDLGAMNSRIPAILWRYHAATVGSAGAAIDHRAPKLVHAVVKRLRRKLGEDGTRAACIRNERGVGYRMPEPDGTSPRDASGPFPLP